MASSVSGLISGAVAGTAGSVNPNGTFTFQVIEPGGSFFGVLDALREDKLLKILAEPTLTAISGRPAYFQVGGSVPTPGPPEPRNGDRRVQEVRHASRLRPHRPG